MIVDTHVHVVSGDVIRYPRQLHGESAWVGATPNSAHDYARTMDANGVSHAVLVQAVGAYTDDNRYCIDAAVADPGRFSAVAYVDPHHQSPGAALARWVEAGAMGVRVVAAAGADPVLMTDSRVVELVETARSLNVPVLLTTMGNGLEHAPALLERFPDVPVALDHCGFPDCAGPPSFPNAAPLFALAQFPMLHVKVSTNALDCARVGGDVSAFVAALAERFGAERMQWGSDWSHTHDRPFATLLQQAREAFAVLGDDASWPLGRSALHFWKWAGTTSDTSTEYDEFLEAWDPPAEHIPEYLMRGGELGED